jgi:hypothetical protein
MTKAQEIAALDAFIAKLGTASYLGPWLADNRAAIVTDITDTSPSAAAGRRAVEARDIVAAAKAEADSLRQAAETTAADSARRRSASATSSGRSSPT